ncbi:hypothetical protein DOM21_17415 [Bacteriovorax stolpii]|uniref:hypothetical protein n=1 Tax=Bacteriovorax stolpii TaxID=960 RepID=UPI001156D381|nr:hypothetical protein [Bacteriovorax stolpii]QDK43202.1 hypothetical protein DOM21_17415 [Bacteriovorax stolpii]
MRKISDFEKAELEEALFHMIVSTNHARQNLRVIRWVRVILSFYSDEKISYEMPTVANKLFLLKRINNFDKALIDPVRDVTIETQLDSRRLPRSVAITYLSILERCHGCYENFEWLKNYIKPNGILENRLKSDGVQLGFKLPKISIKKELREEENRTEWARALKKNLSLTYTTVGKRVIPKGHTEISKKILERLDEIANETLQILEVCRSEESYSSLPVEDRTTPYDILNHLLEFLKTGSSTSLDLLRKLEDELKVPKDFRY